MDVARAEKLPRMIRIRIDDCEVAVAIQKAERETYVRRKNEKKRDH